MSIGNGAPAWPSVIVSNGRISRSEHIPAMTALSRNANPAYTYRNRTRGVWSGSCRAGGA